MIIINESGLYSLILSSKLPSAKRFKHWVTSEVLPALRKTGEYKLGEQPGRILPEDLENEYMRLKTEAEIRAIHERAERNAEKFKEDRHGNFLEWFEIICRIPQKEQEMAKDFLRTYMVEPDVPTGESVAAIFGFQRMGAV